MPLKWFICPDNGRIETSKCLEAGGCRMGDRCATRSYLQLASRERAWTGKPSTTQLIQGTMEAYLKITYDFATSPDSRAFMINGTNAHAKLEQQDDEYSLLEEKFTDGEISGIADVYEQEQGRGILVDYKTSGSFKVAKALGIHIIDVPTGEFFKTGKRKGEPKFRKELRRDESKIDVRDWAWQLNKYRMMFEESRFKVDEIRIQVIVRDGGTYIARSRGVFRNIYYFKIPIIPDEQVVKFFNIKHKALLKSLSDNDVNKIDICSREENWDGLKCEKYCNVAEHCPYGRYLKQNRETEDMAIKGLSEVRRLPRVGKIRLGVKKKNAKGVEYPAEVDYFILDPQTPNDEENKNLINEFHRLYGDQPKQVKIMFPVSDIEHIFPQYYKRYGSAASLKCKGDGQVATCARPEYAEGLEVLGRDEMGSTQVLCKGKECIYYGKECGVSATLNVLLPELPGSGVWQINTGSIHSILNLNSCFDYVRSIAGRAHMIPLTLERRAQEIVHDGRKTTHYIMHVDMKISLSELQKFAQIESTKVALELPEPQIDEQDLLIPMIDATQTQSIETPKTEEEKQKEIEEKLRAMLMEIAGNNTQIAINLLEKYSSFKDKESGDFVAGVKHIKQLSPGRLKTTYGIVKKEYQEIQKQKQSESVQAELIG